MILKKSLVIVTHAKRWMFRTQTVRQKGINVRQEVKAMIRNKESASVR